MARKKIIIILSAIAAIIILSGILIYFFINNNSADNALSSIAVYSPHENSSIVLYIKDAQYNIIATADESVNFQNLSPGTYMVSVAIKDNHACPFTQVIELGKKENIVVQAEIDLNNLCLD